jgi:putative sterol carrier protein
MGIKFPSDEWVKALMVEINRSDAYKDAAKNWEGDFYFVVNKSPGVPQDVYLYMDLWHGACRDAYEVTDPTSKAPEFSLAAPLQVWQRVVEGKMDPIRALMTSQLKLKGTMTKIMKVPKSATELVKCCAKVDTEWPK